MSDPPLTGVGVLVTRPEHQSSALKNAIEAAGGQAILFPVIDIVPRAAAEIENDFKALPAPDIIIFISANAVRYGLEQTRGKQARIAAVGPATTAALEALGTRVDIVAEGGSDSEHLLATNHLSKVAGMHLLIVRGNTGRELLAETLRQRGATVNYLPVYRRRICTPHKDALEKLEKTWRDDHVTAVMIMSVASLDSMLEILPAYCIEQIRETRLVAPSRRVIQTALERIPGLTGILSEGPGALDMTNALIASLQADSETNNG